MPPRLASERAPRSTTTDARPNNSTLPNNIDPLSACVQSAVERALDARWDELLEAVASRPLPQYLDAAGVAQMLGTTTQTVSRLRAEGMPHIRIGELYRYPVDGVTAWLAARGGER